MDTQSKPTKMDLYRKWNTEKDERVAKVIDALDDFGFEPAALKTRVTNLVDSFGEELMRAAMAEHVAPPAAPKAEIKK